MKGEDILFALNEADDEALLRAERMLTQRQPLRFRRSLQVLLAAAVLLFALGGIGWYVYRSAISSRSLKRGETLTYHEVFYDETEEYQQEIRLSGAGLIIRVDTAAESPVCLFKAPEGETLRTGRLNLWSVLEMGELPEGVFTLFPPELRVGLEEGLRRTGVGRTDAVDLCFRWFQYEEGREAPVLMAEIFNAYDLCRKDLILGIRNAEVEIVSEPGTEGIQRLEVRHHRILDSNYLLQYDPELQCLLVVCGDAERYVFPALEAFADSLEIRQTDLCVAAREDSERDWRLLDAPDGWLPEARTGQ